MRTHSTRRNTSPCGDVQETICDIWPDGIVEMSLAIRVGNVSSKVTRSYQEPSVASRTPAPFTSAKQTEGLSGGRSPIPKRSKGLGRKLLL
jgi:hypothetical protein